MYLGSTYRMPTQPRVVESTSINPSKSTTNFDELAHSCSIGVSQNLPLLTADTYFIVDTDLIFYPYAGSAYYILYVATPAR
jgi:hypothetical protein